MIISPPLVTTREQIDELVDKACAALDASAVCLADQPSKAREETLS